MPGDNVCADKLTLRCQGEPSTDRPAPALTIVATVAFMVSVVRLPPVSSLGAISVEERLSMLPFTGLPLQATQFW